MSCHEYRYLLQHRFDEELDQHEIASLDDHVDACESCAKFEHQLDQMIQGAEEMPLPEELTPPNPEALAKLIQQQLPQQKSSVFGMFMNLFGGAGGGAAAGGKTQGAARAKGGRAAAGQGSRERAGAGKTMEKGRRGEEEAEAAVASRLKSLAREPDDSREVQSTTKGLGEKFGFGSNALGASSDATPLTLAESIRRKISESQKMSIEDEDTSPPGDRLTAVAGAPPSADGNWNTPIKMPGQDAGWNPAAAQAQGGGAWTPQASGTGAHPGSAIGLAPPDGEGDWQDKRAPRGTSPGDEDSGWGPPPAGGSWEEPAQQQQQQNAPWQQGGAAGGAPQANWGSPPQAEPAANSWGANAQASWATSPSPTQPNTDQFASGGWNVPPSAKANQTSAPIEPAGQPGWSGGSQPPGQDNSWASGSGAVSSWGNPPNAQPANEAPASQNWNDANQQQQGASWGGDSNWGGQPQAQPAAPQAQSGWTGSTSQDAAPVSNDSWGKSQAGNSNWGTQPGSAPGQAEPQPSWGGGQGSSSWGTPQQPAAAPAPEPAPSWGTQAPSPTWGQAPQAQAETTSGNWTATPAQAQQPQAQAQGDWAGDSAAGGWGGGQQPQQQDDSWKVPKQTEGSGWGANAQAQPGWDTNKQWAADQEKSEEARRRGERGNWSIEAEQMETGTWNNYSGAQANALGAKPAPQARPTVTPEERWDTSIQDRPAQPPPQAPAQPQPVENHWDVPIQEKLKSNTGSQPMPAQAQTPAPGWGQAPAQAAAPQAPDNSHWDLPIQEKLKKMDEAPAAPAFAGQEAPFGGPPQGFGAPPAFGGQPEQAQPPGFGQPAPSAPPFGQAPMPAEPPPGFGQAPPPFAAQPAPAPAPQPAPQAAPSWGTPPSSSSTLFGKPLDDNAINKIFDENLGIKDTPVAGAAPQPQQPPPQPAPQPAPMQQSGWGVPTGQTPPPAPVPDTMSFAPETQQAQDAPRLTAIPPKTGEVQAPAQAPPPAAPMPPTMPQQPQISQAQSKQQQAGIFSLDDDAVDKIFAKMGVEESSIPVNQAAPAPPAMPAPSAMPPAPPQMPAPPPTMPPAMGTPPGMPGGMNPGMPSGMNPGMAAPQPNAGFGSMPQAPGFGQPPMAPPPQMAPPAMPAPAPAAPKPAANTAGALFQVDDSDMDNLFDKVLINPEPGAPMPSAAPMPMPPAPPAMPPQGMPGMQPSMPPQMQPQGGMPGYGGMPPGNGQFPMPQQQPPQAMPAPEPPPPPVAVAHVPPSAPPPKIEGIGKLDASADVAETGSGRIAAIGKFLLDQKDLEKLSRITAADQQDIKMRILTLEASEDLQTLLSEIGGQEKVIGSVIVGHDGLLIANTMPEEVDAESIGVWALGVYMNTEHVTKKMGHERVHQVVSRTPRGYVVIADFGGGLLVTITDGTETDTLIPLMRKITDLVS